MALSSSEVQALRRHLGYGNISTGAYPYTPDGFVEMFSNVIAPNLQTAAQTTATTAITAGNTTTVTPASMTEIVAYARLVVDVGDAAEIVTVKSVTATTFSATFANSHPASGYPIAVESGEAVLRLLLHSADRIWLKYQGPSITSTAGLKSVGQGEAEWFPGGAVRREIYAHYVAIVDQIAQLVRVNHMWPRAGGAVTLEPY